MEEVALILVILAGLQLGKLMLRWNRDRRDNDELRQIRELNETMRGTARFLPSGSQIREWEQNMVAAHGNGDEDAQDPRGWDALDREMRARVRQLAADGVPSLALFGTGTGRSDALLRDIESIAERLGFGSLWPDTASVYSVRESLRSTDVTLVDCTVESENGYEVVQYGFYSEFAVVVSSSALPVNFPSFLPVAPTYPTTWPHEHLLSEVERRLRRLVAQFPRETGPEGYRSEEELAHEIQMAKLSAEAGRKAQGQVFVSYRSRHGDSVRAWLDDAGDKTVKVFSPGELALGDC